MLTERISNRPAWADVDLGAVAANVGAMAELVAPAAVGTVVKADGYGHGAVPVAATALASGATWLAVALAEEGAVLRSAGIEAPVLLLSEPSPAEHGDVVALGLRPTVYSPAGIDGLEAAVSAAGTGPLRVHLKVDTGMHRVGARPAEIPTLVERIGRSHHLVLEGLWTHCAVADEPDHPATTRQVAAFEAVVDDLIAKGRRPPLVHAANSAAAIDQPALRHDLVRAGITAYGLAPSTALAGRLTLHPALSLRARVTHLQVVAAGEAVSYGLRRPAQVDSVVATVPLGYADGVPRRLSSVGGSVLVGGRRCPLAGTVTMDQLLVDCGPVGDLAAEAVDVGDEVVLLGRQGEASIGAEEWAERLGTISYEIVCGISPRVPRRYHGRPRR